MSTKPEDALLGRIALHYKLISQPQLDAALKLQASEKPRMRLGEILAQQNVVSAEQLQWLLNAQEQYLAKQKAAASGAPAPAPSAPAPSAAVAAPRPSAPAPAPIPAPAPSRPIAISGKAAGTLEAILLKAIEHRASDVHIHSGAPIQMRVNGQLREMKTGVFDADATRDLLLAVLTPEQRTQLLEKWDLDLALQLSCGRFRVSMYRQQRGFDAVFRPIAPTPPTLEQLGLPPTLKRLTEFHQGLVLVTGPAGCGKSSTLAALVNMVNETRKDHIITVEDPIEYVHSGKGCIVNQRQAGKHTLSFANALRAALREDPDVIVIGELRDLETMSLAITAAETGHLVMGTLHTNNAVRTINRILDAFPPKQQSQIRAMVSESLRAIVSQRLLTSADGSRLVPALEMLFVKPAVSNLIRDQKTFQLRSIMQTGRAEGMCLLDDSLADLVKAKQITVEAARRVCEDPKRFGPGGQ
jgi:twitching motility protein PilT